MIYKTIPLIVSMILGGTALAGHAQCQNGGACPDASAVHECAPQKDGFCVALKTNMLYDALLVPNAGVELHIGKGWTVGADWAFAWWKNDAHRFCWRVCGGSLGVRRYIGRAAAGQPFAGHHAGAYAQIFTYDFQAGRHGYMAGKPGGTLSDQAGYAFGLEYGYSLPVGRCLSIDFSLGAGYMGGKYHEYISADGCAVWQKRSRRHWFGPTKAEVSLVWRLGGDKRKGGDL